MKVKITIVVAEQEPLVLEKGEHMIGRGDAESGVFPEIDLEPYDTEAKVSRKHAVLKISHSIVTIEDVGSLNGTFVNRKPRLAVNTKQQLHSGDEVAIGATFMRIEFI